MISATCRDLLADSQRFAAEYANGFSNHLPMALVALDGLGADDARLREFAASYSKQLRPKSANAYEVALSDRFSRDLRERGRDALLQEVAPRLTNGLASEAFHGLIRLAYAVDSGEDVDVASALAAWEIGFSELPPGSQGARFETFADAFAAIAGDERFPQSLEGRSIQGRIVRVAALSAFQDYCGTVRHAELSEIATISTEVFASTNDFTALHMVTACHATRILSPFLARHALDVLATAILAAYVTIGRPPITIEPLLAADLPDDATLAAHALPSDDEHDLKLVYSCRREEAEYGSRIHRLAAAVRLGLV